MDDNPSARLLGVAVIAAVQAFRGLLLMAKAWESDVLAYLSLFDPHDVQDFADGVGASRGRQEIPMEDRFWMRVGRWMPSRSFVTLFRCSRPTFTKLVRAVYGTTGMRTADGGRGPDFNPCERTAMALYRLGHGAGVRATAALFGVSDGWVCNQTKDFVRRAANTLTPTYLRWPTRNEQDSISEAFETRTGFRDAILAIDGSHIPIPAPSGRDMQAYYNYKGFYSVILLAIVDNAGMFRWISCGAPGSCGDAGVWRWCKQSKRIATEQTLPEPARTQVCRDRHIVGDSAFGNRAWLLTPWDTPSSRAQRFFNYVHSQTRFVVEHAFGRLKDDEKCDGVALNKEEITILHILRGLSTLGPMYGDHCSLTSVLCTIHGKVEWKFMCLKNRMYFRIEAVPDIIRVCVVLYNFILAYDGIGKDEVFMDDMPTRRARASRASGSSSSGGASGAPAAGEGAAARQRETDYLAANFLVQTWGEEGSAVDRAREEAEARYRAAPGGSQGGGPNA